MEQDGDTHLKSALLSKPIIFSTGRGSTMAGKCGCRKLWKMASYLSRESQFKDENQRRATLPDFNPLKERQQFFLRRRELVGEIVRTVYAQGQAATV